MIWNLGQFFLKHKGSTLIHTLKWIRILHVAQSTAPLWLKVCSSENCGCFIRQWMFIISERSKCSLFNRKLIVLITAIKTKFLRRKKQQVHCIIKAIFKKKSAVISICEMPKHWKRQLRNTIHAYKGYKRHWSNLNFNLTVQQTHSKSYKWKKTSWIKGDKFMSKHHH